ncbi:uncharacterized protein PAM68-like [Olea europaea var. sylvestris]|uniref:Uncharacterized protein PAM68-like n=1 Tax=Olea europaea subsp. europaea TaxID=158383 RepID=A0A8S0UE88_OLEEU|nr:uncharacterized protein PAM68-like [Olea europaea var. sylvestris]CAA3013777.1 uncharacterized protein PAM68-like [Olea europaea subsp. europaea]
MKTLSILQQTPLHITKSTPWWKRRSNPFLHQLHCKNPQNWRQLQAGAKGFGGTSSSSSSSSTTNIQEQPKDKQKPGGKSYRKTEDNDDKIPDAVWERMISRILFYVGVPLITGFALLQVLGALKEQKLWDVPNWVPFLTSFVTFGSSALGIAYGTLSTSWDIEKEGSFLGFEQAQKNWDEVWKEEDENNM